MAPMPAGGATAGRRGRDAVLIAAATALIGVIEFWSGIEYRVFPLYFIPLSWAAWRLGRGAALLTAAACTIAWGESSYLAGLRYTNWGVWAVNLVMQGAAFAVVGILIAELRRALDREATLSRTDPLTNLLNARAFEEESRRMLALAERHGHPVTLAYVDLDRFKSINDTYGHHAGDRVLRHVADMLRRELRATDVYARLGGDEFVALLPETAPDEAARLLERLRCHIAHRGPGQPDVSATIGAVSSLAPSAELEPLLRRADMVMYEAKASGRDRVRMEIIPPFAPESTRRH